MARISINTWFAENKPAATVVTKFVAARDAGSSTPVRTLLEALIRQYDFPFSSEPSLVRYLKAQKMDTNPRYNAPVAPEVEVEAVEIPSLTKGRAKAIKKARRWVITAAQNNTPVDGDFLSALEGYAANHGSELIVRPIRYKNPTSNIVPEHEVIRTACGGTSASCRTWWTTRSS